MTTVVPGLTRDPFVVCFPSPKNGSRVKPGMTLTLVSDGVSKGLQTLPGQIIRYRKLFFAFTLSPLQVRHMVRSKLQDLSDLVSSQQVIIAA